MPVPILTSYKIKLILINFKLKMDAFLTHEKHPLQILLLLALKRAKKNIQLCVA